VSRDDFILGAQWYSEDNGMTWTRHPSRLPRGPGATQMTVCAVDKDRGEVTVHMDLGKVFGLPPKPVVHVYSPELPNGSLRGRAVCGEIVMHPDMGGSSVREGNARDATCAACRKWMGLP